MLLLQVSPDGFTQSLALFRSLMRTGVEDDGQAVLTGSLPEPPAYRSFPLGFFSKLPMSQHGV